MIVDAHQDLAWNALTYGRDYTRSVEQTRALEAGTAVIKQNGNTLLGWPDWIQGDVGLIFATLYAGPERLRLHDWETGLYTSPEEARRMYRRQLQYYQRLFDENEDKFRPIHSRGDLAEHLRAWEAEPDRRRLGVVLLMEGADGVREPAEIEWWMEQGIRIVGPAWGGTRYSGGTAEPGPLTELGFELLERMADLGLMLDISHMAETAARQALERYGGGILASHSNPRRLLMHTKYPDRHLSDEVIDLMAERGGTIGVVLGNSFLKDGWVRGDPREQVGMEHVIEKIDYYCQHLGTAEHVGIGSDFDGGFGLEWVPSPFDSIADLQKIGQALRERGWDPDDVQAVMGGNWLRTLESGLPV